MISDSRHTANHRPAGGRGGATVSTSNRASRNPMAGQKGMVGNRHLPRCWDWSGARRVGRQSQQGQVCRTSTRIEDSDQPQVMAVLPPHSWSWGPPLPSLTDVLPSQHPDRQLRSRRQGTAHRQGQHEPDAGQAEPDVGQAKPDTSRAGSNFQLLQFPRSSVGEPRAKETQLV